MRFSVAMAAAGMGITPLALRSFRVTGHPAIKYINIDSELVHIDHVLAWRKDNAGKAVTAFA
jgi:DNA-binding transcriptional LysR family regulator